MCGKSGFAFARLMPNRKRRGSESAAARLDALLRRSDPASLVFAHADATRLQGAMPRQTGNASWNAAAAGLIEIQLGHTDKAIALLETALLLPDRNLSHHFSRVALAGIKR